MCVQGYKSTRNNSWAKMSARTTLTSPRSTYSDKKEKDRDFAQKSVRTIWFSLHRIGWSLFFCTKGPIHRYVLRSASTPQLVPGPIAYSGSSSGSKSLVWNVVDLDIISTLLNIYYFYAFHASNKLAPPRSAAS